MAMQAVKHGPDQRGLLPPLGPAPPKGKAKAKVLQFPSAKRGGSITPLVKGIRASMPAKVLTDLEFAVEYRILNSPKPKAKALAGGSGNGGGNKEWRPTWNWDYGGGNALWNLLANAELMTPVGRKFIPDPDYKGEGLSPPQRDPLSTQFDNVFKMSEAKAKALEKTRHSDRSRGHIYQQVEGPPKGIVGPVQPPVAPQAVQVVVEESSVDGWDDNRTKDWGKLDLSGFGWSAANDDMLSGNTDEPLELSHEEKHALRLEHMCYFPHHVGTQLSIDGVFQLSPSCTVEPLGADQVMLEYQLKSGYKAVRRMTNDEFYYRLDDGGIPFNAYLWKDLSPYQLMDEVVYDMFSFHLVNDWASHEGFETWTNGELAMLFHWHNKAHWVSLVERDAVFEGISPPATDLEILRWEKEAYYGALDGIADARKKHKEYVQSQARLKVFGAPKAKIVRGFPHARKLNDDNRYKKYWLEQYVFDEEFRLEYRLAKGRDMLVEPRAYVPVSIGHPTRMTKVKQKAKKVWKLLNTPINDFFRKSPKYAKVADVPEPVVPYEAEQVRVDTVAEAMAVRMTYLGSLQDDQYDLQWLEKLAGRTLDPNKGLPSAVELAIKAVEQDVPTDEFSEEGIYLGKTTQLPRTEAGIILVTHMPNSNKGSSPIAA